ncbi:MAG TPA: helix-turn-helix transcriptional regulator [Bacteroidales bacterium]|nr:helix-turn-helix transcriptional regulator [Bacteroidales bacterium]
MQQLIYSLDLKHNDIPVPFSIRRMEDIDAARGGITDDPHRHNYYTIIWPFKAKGKHVIDFREYTIEPDQIFFVSPGQVHQVIAEPAPEGVVVLFTPEYLQKNSIKEDFINNLRLFRTSDENPPLPIPGEMKTNLLQFVDAMCKAFDSDDEMRFDIIGAYLKLFLITCNGHCSLYPPMNPQNIEVGRNIMRSFKALVEVHFYEWHQVQEYARELNVTPNYLNEVIKTGLNVSAKDYIQQRVTLEAKRLVAFTTKSAKEIGFDLGFEDPSHFSKFFKSHTGHSLQTFKESLSV